MTASDRLLALDDAISIAANAGVGAHPSFDALLHWATVAPTLKFGLPIAVLCWLWSRGGPAANRDREAVVVTVIAAFVALFVARALAVGLPFRPRPLARPDLGLTVLPEFVHDLGRWSAFPSDHAVLAFALAAGVLRASRPLAALLTLHAALVVCAPRLVFGLHHPSDLVVGAGVGAALASIAGGTAVGPALAARVLALRSPAPGLFASIGFLVLLQVATMFQDVRTLASTVAIALRGGP